MSIRLCSISNDWELKIRSCWCHRCAVLRQLYGKSNPLQRHVSSLQTSVCRNDLSSKPDARMSRARRHSAATINGRRRTWTSSLFRYRDASVTSAAAATGRKCIRGYCGQIDGTALSEVERLTHINFNYLVNVSLPRVNRRGLRRPTALRFQSVTYCRIWTSNPWVVKLSWLENAYSRPVLSTGDLDKESRSGWPGSCCVIRVRYWVCACKIRSVCVQRLGYERLD